MAADDLATSVALMAKIRACTSPSFAPDGQRLAFVSNLTGVPQVWTVAAEGGWPELVTALDDQVTRVAWSPDGAWLAFSLAPGGGLNQQIYVCRPDGSAMRRLSDGGRENNRLNFWARDSRALAVSSNRRSPEAMDAWLVDVASGELRLAARNQGIGALTDLSPDGRRAIVARMVSRGDNNLFLVDLATGAETLLTPHTGPGAFDAGHFAPDGRAIYCTSDQDREFAALARAWLDAEGRPGPLEVVAARADADLEQVAFSEDGRTAALVWNVAGRSQLAFCELATGVVTPGPALPAEVVWEVTFARDGRRLALNLTGAATPTDIWVYDLDRGALWPATHSAHAGVKLEQLVRPELVRLEAHDELELTGWLYRPPAGAAPYPLVISFHGGPEAQERPYFNSTYQALLAQGIAVFAPNVRGSAGFGKTFVNLDNGPLRVNAVRDIQACVDYVTWTGIADARRVGIMGGSYGGFMTTAGLTEYPDRFAAAATLCGMVNFETFFAQTEPWMAAISKVEYGDPETQADLLRQLSPIHKIDRILAPTLVLHGANDTNVPVVEAEQVVDSLRRRNVPVEYVLFPDEGHGFTKTANRIQAAVAIVRWFVEHLTGPR